MQLKMILDIPPSINSCYVNAYAGGRKGRLLTEAARNWKTAAFWLAKAAARSYGWQMPEKEQKVIVEVYAYWPDARRHDMNNTHKLLCDALEGVVYYDDCMALVRDMDFAVDRKRPRLEICCRLKEG